MNETKSNWSRLKTIILNVLSDGEEHSFTQLREAVIAEDAGLLTSSNTLSAVLYQLMRQNSRVIRTGKATYRYAEETKPSVADESDHPPQETEKILNEFRTLLRRLDQMIDKPSYEMSEKEFAEHRNLYLLGKQLHKVMDPHL